MTSNQMQTSPDINNVPESMVTMNGSKRGAAERELAGETFTHEIISALFDNSRSELAAFKSIRNPEGGIIDFEWMLANETSASAMYTQPHQMIGKRLLEQMPEVYDELFPLYVKVVESGLSERLEKLYKLEGKASKCLFITITKSEDGFVTTLADITAQKIQRALLEERETLLNEAESLAKMGSWKWTESNDELHWSKGLYKIFAKNPDEPVSWSMFMEDVHPDDVFLMEDYLHQVKTNKLAAVIYYRTMKNDCVRHFSLTTRPHTQNEFDIFGAVVDVTEHRENQRQLQQYNLNQERIINELDEKEKRYRALFERSIDPIFLVTDKLIFSSVNASFLNLTGYAGIENSSIALSALFSNPDDYEKFRIRLLQDGQIRDFEVDLVTLSGEKKYCLLNCVFISDPNLDHSYYQGIIHDLTQRQQAENDMLMAERFSLTGKIARTIAHEVRNPLTNISLALDQLRGEMSATNESAILYSDIIERNANRIEELMGEMLNTSRQRKLNLGLILVNDLLNDTLKLAQDRINLNQIQLITHVRGNLPRVLVDKEKIQIAFLNIIINAIEAMTPGSGVLKVNASCHEDTITIEIADNGKGIPAQDLKKLFDPFFTSKQSGMGLGLTSTKNIFNSHNAHVEVMSVVNKGTTFYIQFKLAE